MKNVEVGIFTYFFLVTSGWRSKNSEEDMACGSSRWIHCVCAKKEHTEERICFCHDHCSLVEC